uniref:Uncharacterized protein n=1 Tax=Thermosphaera aggregans TaxID=54254 RepID=A0A7C2FET6_9CREN
MPTQPIPSTHEADPPPEGRSPVGIPGLHKRNAEYPSEAVSSLAYTIVVSVTLMRVNYERKTIRITIRPGEYLEVSWASK